MGVKKGTVKKAVSWTKCDTVLLVFTFLLATAAILIACLFFPRRWPDTEDGVEPNYVMTTCTIKKVELTGELVACTQNERGEWCEEIRLKRDAPPRGRHFGPGQRRFPCLNVGVEVNPTPLLPHIGPGRWGHHGHHDQEESSEEEEESILSAFFLHEDFIEAENFPQCTTSSCGEWWSDNEEAVQADLVEFQRASEDEVEMTCFVDVQHPDSGVALSTPPGWRMVVKNRSFHSFLWCAIGSGFFIVLLLIRRCHSAAKTIYHEQHKVEASAPSKDSQREKKQAYAQSESDATARNGCSTVSLGSIPEKQPLPDIAGDATFHPGIYFLAGPPPAYDQRGDAAQLADSSRPISAPPPYEISIRPLSDLQGNNNYADLEDRDLY